MTSALVFSLVLAPVEHPACREAGRSTMDPRLEHALQIRTRIRVREPRRPVEVASVK